MYHVIFKVQLILLCVFMSAILAACSEPPNHLEAYLSENNSSQLPVSELRSRIILFGDAGASAINPLQPSLKIALSQAVELPEQTSILVLGDNIYDFGYPKLLAGESVLNAEQKLLISHLDAQLEVSRRSGAEMFVLPGNHDWFAGQVDDQAEYIEEVNRLSEAEMNFVPYRAGQLPFAQVVHRDGISLIFLDSMWMISAKDEVFERAIVQLTGLLEQVHLQHPSNLLLLAAHHPLQSMGPHFTGYGFLGNFIRWVYEKYMGWDYGGDLDDAPYQRYIHALEKITIAYPKVVFAAGHDHSLQLFKSANASRFDLVSGAANASKVSMVAHNENTLFAQAIEGLMVLDVYTEGVLLSVYTVEELPSPAKATYRYWLWRG